MKSNVATDIANNSLSIKFKGIITIKELKGLYTDIRFGVADLKPEFSVISDFSSCRLMYLNGLPTFRKIFHYILSNESGEIVRVIHPKRLISKQIINASLMRKGYKPIYVSTIEEAEEKIKKSVKRAGLRIELNELPVDILYNSEKYDGHILNISTSGCAITSSSLQPNQGDLLQIKFAFANKSSPDIFNLKGKVIRVESYTFAMNFVSLDNQEKSTLWRCLVDETEGEVR